MMVHGVVKLCKRYVVRNELCTVRSIRSRKTRTKVKIERGEKERERERERKRAVGCSGVK